MLLTPEIILYIYIIVNICVILFNFACVIVRKANERLQINYENTLIKHVHTAMQDYLKTGELSKRHMRYMSKRLRLTHWLTAFNHIVVSERIPRDVASVYVNLIAPLFSEIIPFYRPRNATTKSYFAYMLSEFNATAIAENDFINEFMLNNVIGDSIYLRENCLHALYSFGNVNNVKTAILKMDRNNVVHNTKLITDGLLTFTGDKERLAGELLDELAALNESYKIAVINYAAFISGEYKAKLLPLIQPDADSKEVILAAMRYFRKHPDQAAEPILIEYLKDDNNKDWEYAAVAANVLDAYPTEASKVTLMDKVTSPQWYVRQNAIKSLDKLGLSEEELERLMSCGDRYATEQLEYILKEQS